MRKRIAAAIASWFGRALAWLRRDAYVKAVVEAVAKQAYIDGHNAGVASVLESHHAAVAQARECAQAYGELIGRQILAHELELAHGIGEGGERAMTADEVGTLVRRQLH